MHSQEKWGAERSSASSRRYEVHLWESVILYSLLPEHSRQERVIVNMWIVIRKKHTHVWRRRTVVLWTDFSACSPKISHLWVYIKVQLLVLHSSCN